MIKRTDNPGDVDTSAMSQWERAISGNWYCYAADKTLENRIEASKGAPLPGIHPSCNVIEPISIDYPERFVVGENTLLNHHLETLSAGMVTIGKNCFIGPHARFYTPNHHITDLAFRRAGWQYDAPITVGDDVWFGGSVVVCPGVTIGNNVVVAAGSVVTKDFPSNVIIGGNPARIIKEIEGE
ncbi:MAG: sugar O-acetyltransferase [Lactobacillales bacterium]|jgi:maltose O-acetyltransferase|nr:sugar O-acetyltransferase [Lactobacillales bacterium]